MKLEQQLKLQSYLDGEMPERERRDVAGWLERDGEARAWFAELQTTREVLAGNANWMRSNAQQRVVIEGHCDSRGSTEYNLALGERRGLIVRSYLGQLGIGVDRLEVVSYGEEPPLDFGNNESAFSRNRRAEFRTR